MAALESRLAPAVTAVWDAFSNTLTVTVTGGDTAVVTTKGGSDVSVLDQFAAEMLVDTVPASSVHVIDMTSTAGSNQIDLSGLDPALYTDTNLLVGIDGSAAGDALVTSGEDQNFDFDSANGGTFEPRGTGAGGTGSFDDIATVTSAGGNDQFHFDEQPAEWFAVSGLHPFVRDHEPELADGDYTLQVLQSPITDSLGQHLDGNGDGVTGDNYTAPAGLIHRFFGDADGDPDTDSADFLAFRVTSGLSQGDPGFNPAFDFDGDNDVDGADFLQFRDRFGSGI